MADKSKAKTRNHAVKDLPIRDAKAAAVKGGREASSGMATGRRQYKPLILTVDPTIVTK